jgi:hypothetical protein
MNYEVRRDDDETLWVIETDDRHVNRWWVYLDASTGMITATRRAHHAETLTFKARNDLEDRWPADIVAAVLERVGTARRPDEG